MASHDWEQWTLKVDIYSRLMKWIQIAQNPIELDHV